MRDTKSHTTFESLVRNIHMKHAIRAKYNKDLPWLVATSKNKNQNSKITFCSEINILI